MKKWARYISPGLLQQINKHTNKLDWIFPRFVLQRCESRYRRGGSRVRYLPIKMLTKTIAKKRSALKSFFAPIKHVASVRGCRILLVGFPSISLLVSKYLQTLSKYIDVCEYACLKVFLWETNDEHFREVQPFPQCQLRSRLSQSLGLQGLLLLLFFDGWTMFL